MEKHHGRIENLSIYGQEKNSTTWKLLAIRGIDVNIGAHHSDTFHNELHKILKVDFIFANPSFNISDWSGKNLTNDVIWKFGISPKGSKICIVTAYYLSFSV